MISKKVIHYKKNRRQRLNGSDLSSTSWLMPLLDVILVVALTFMNRPKAIPVKVPKEPLKKINIAATQGKKIDISLEFKPNYVLLNDEKVSYARYYTIMNSKNKNIKLGFLNKEIEKRRKELIRMGYKPENIKMVVKKD